MARFRSVLALVVLSLLLLSSSAFADTTPEQYVIGAGTGFSNINSPNPQGWATFCTKISDGNFACTALDILGLPSKGSSGANLTSFRAGYERVVFRNGPITLTAKADAGISTVLGNVGGSYGGGGSLLFKIPKTQNLHAVGSFTLLKSTVGDVNPEFVLRFGVLYAFGNK